MASDSTSVPQPGASSQHTVVKIIATTREKELWSKFDLCEMSNGEQKARCKACGGFLKANSNMTLRSHIGRYCKTLKGVPAQGQTTIGSDGGIWNFSTNMVRERMGKFVIQEGQRGNTPSSELGRYSGNGFLSTMTPEEFESINLLAWWKRKETEFPILSAMARDLLTVQASTVASESAFSFSGRVLSVRRTRLTPTALEMCICLKDHLDAAERIQDKTNLKDEISIEVVVHDEEVQSGTSPPVSGEELAYDLASRIGNYDSSDD
ncbi:hypothetical protein QVD17_30284 [Tagetes erecta]|uniref:HAT C-terminal dimerisation domain-containing protein n=1 Tax=Tagetes erecta TaxID=13708 RepID=A0AAD8K2G2_TARER|nr:hypothetical protein QVD17_30284 [Tagetes erecta]